MFATWYQWISASNIHEQSQWFLSTQYQIKNAELIRLLQKIHNYQKKKKKQGEKTMQYFLYIYKVRFLGCDNGAIIYA